MKQSLEILLKNKVWFDSRLNLTTEKKDQAIKKLTDLLTRPGYILIGNRDHISIVLTECGTTIKFVPDDNEKMNRAKAGGLFRNRDNTITIYYSYLRDNILPPSLLAHEFWHAYKNYVGKHHMKLDSFTLTENDKKELHSFPFPPYAYAKEGEKFQMHLNEGKKPIEDFINLEKNKAKLKGTKKDLYDKYQKAFATYEPEFSLILLPHPDWIKDFNDYKKLITARKYLRIEKEEGGEAVYLVDLIHDQTKSVVYGKYFYYPPDQKPQIALRYLEDSEKFHRNSITAEKKQILTELGKRLKISAETMIERYIMLEMDATIISFGQNFTETFYPNLRKYHAKLQNDFLPQLNKADEQSYICEGETCHPQESNSRIFKTLNNAGFIKNDELALSNDQAFEQNDVQTSAANKNSVSWFSTLFTTIMDTFNYWFNSSNKIQETISSPKLQSKSTEKNTTQNYQVTQIDGVPALEIAGSNYKLLVFPKTSSVEVASSPNMNNSAINSDAYNIASCRPVEYSGKDAVYCEGENTNLIYTPKLPSRPLENSGSQLMLFATLVYGLYQLFKSDNDNLSLKNLLTAKQYQSEIQHCEKRLQELESLYQNVGEELPLNFLELQDDLNKFKKDKEVSLEEIMGFIELIDRAKVTLKYKISGEDAFPINVSDKQNFPLGTANNFFVAPKPTPVEINNGTAIVSHSSPPKMLGK